MVKLFWVSSYPFLELLVVCVWSGSCRAYVVERVVVVEIALHLQVVLVAVLLLLLLL